MATKLAFDRDAPKIGNYALGNTLGHGTFGKVKGELYIYLTNFSFKKILLLQYLFFSCFFCHSFNSFIHLTCCCKCSLINSGNWVGRHSCIKLNCCCECRPLFCCLSQTAPINIHHGKGMDKLLLHIYDMIWSRRTPWYISLIWIISLGVWLLLYRDPVDQ